MSRDEIKQEFKDLYHLGRREYTKEVHAGKLHLVQFKKRMERLQRAAHVLAVLTDEEWEDLVNRPIRKPRPGGKQQSFFKS